MLSFCLNLDGYVTMLWRDDMRLLFMDTVRCVQTRGPLSISKVNQYSKVADRPLQSGASW